MKKFFVSTAIVACLLAPIGYNLHTPTEITLNPVITEPTTSIMMAIGETEPKAAHITSPSGIEVEPTEPEETQPTTPAPIPTEPEPTPTEPTTPAPVEPEPAPEEPIHIHTFGEWTVLTPATCITGSEEMRECIECGFQQQRTGNRIKLAITTKTKIIDGAVVEYLSCANCDEDTTHLPPCIWYEELGYENGSHGIRSITLLDNDICKIVIIPLDTSISRSECYITNKTDEKLYLMSEGSYLVKDVPAGETVVKNVVEPIAEGTTIMSGEWQRNCYTLDDGVYIECVFVPDNRIEVSVSISNLNPYQ